MRRHPDVERSPLGKEVHYFDRFWQGNAPDEIAAEYASLFPRPPGKVVGEWTPRYLADFWTAPLIRKAAPDARILVMLRDPVARYRSAIARLHRLAEERGSRVLLASISDATWRGFYYQQLRHVFGFFPREQVLVLQFERCVQDPTGEMERTWRFLGLEPPEKTPGRLFKHRQAGRSSPELSPQVSEELAERYRDDALRLAELCPEIDLSLWAGVSGERRARRGSAARVGAL
jgi:hypothetical protein